MRAPQSLWAESGKNGSPQVLCSQERRQHQQNFYEVIADGKPCWLYFDLEFNRVANPSSDPERVASDFYKALDQFLVKVLGSPHDSTSVVELD